MDWLIVAFFGGLVGTGELIDRYRKAPVRYMWNLPAVFYVTSQRGVVARSARAHSDV